jgi:hypothetical protein
MTTPYTEMLALYRACPRGLTEGEAYGRELLRAPDRVAALFGLSVAQFSRYSNIDESFHDGSGAPGFSGSHGKAITRTVDVAKRLADAERCSVEGGEDFGFRYVDRELDVMRTSTTQLLDDGTNSKRALVLDLLLARTDGTPILTEVKIGKDTHPHYALIQVLAAAAHLVTPAQRARLARCYSDSIVLPERAPFIELAVLLVDKPVAGKAATMLSDAQDLAEALMRNAAVSSLIRAIHFLAPADLSNPALTFRRAEVVLDQHLG